jgi:hypothetical protein
MKKRLLFTSFCAFAISASAQFTANRLAVVKVGSGSTVANARTSPVFIEEYLTSSSDQSAPTYSIPVATETVGSNFRLTSIMRESASVFQPEGMSGLSPDGNFLAIIGYDKELGAAVDNSTVKVVGLINAQGEINTSTTLTGNSPARATIALPGGNAVYSSILGAGIRYSAIGSSSSTLINSYVGNARSYTIFNNTLYCANNDSQVPYYNNLPTAPVASRSGDMVLPGISNINQIALFDSDGDGSPNIVYAANGNNTLANAGLYKFVLESGAWTAKGLVSIVGLTDGLRSVTGKAVGGDIELYVTTWGNLGTPKVPSQLLKIIDLDAANSTLNNNDNLPVKLTSFTGQKKTNGIALKWATVSETNNAHFEVLRASNAKDFVKIGEVKGSGNSSTHQSYHFLDSRPAQGNNYYRLKQVDFNGNSELSNIIVVDFNLMQNGLKAWQAGLNTLQLSFSAKQKGIAHIVVADLNGRKLYSGNSLIWSGSNDVAIPMQSASGLYVVSVNTGNEFYSTKFLK